MQLSKRASYLAVLGLAGAVLTLVVVWVALQAVSPIEPMAISAVALAALRWEKTSTRKGETTWYNDTVGKF